MFFGEMMLAYAVMFAFVLGWVSARQFDGIIKTHEHHGALRELVREVETHRTIARATHRIVRAIVSRIADLEYEDGHSNDVNITLSLSPGAVNAFYELEHKLEKATKL